MILIGHRFIDSEELYHIDTTQSISKTPPNSTVYIFFNEENLDIIKHCAKNGVKFALHVNSVAELIYAENLGAAYITVDAQDAKNAQQIANEYLFDAKILALITDEEQIEELAYQGIDGALFTHAIIKITS